MTGMGQRIREKRKEMGLTLAVLSARAQVSRTYLWEIEKGKATQPSVEIMLRLSKSLGLSIDFLAKGEEYAPGHEELSIPGEVASMADSLSMDFRQVYCLLKVARTLEQSSSRFQLKPVAWDWRLLYERVKEWL